MSISQEAIPTVERAQRQPATGRYWRLMIVDRYLLREFVQTYAQGLPADDVERLRDELDQQLERRMKDARKAGRDAFRRGAKKFVRRVAKAVRRDLTPADDNGRDGADGADDDQAGDDRA